MSRESMTDGISFINLLRGPRISPGLRLQGATRRRSLLGAAPVVDRVRAGYGHLHPGPGEGGGGSGAIHLGHVCSGKRKTWRCKERMALPRGILEGLGPLFGVYEG
jgi:hypothetical protein